MKKVYKVNGREIEVTLQGKNEYTFGSDEILSLKYSDITSHMDWFKEGFSILKCNNFFKHSELYIETTNLIKNTILDINPSLNLKYFRIEDYHNFVSKDLHRLIVAKTRRIYPPDIGLNLRDIVEKFEDYLGCRLTFINPISNNNQWMIIRINKPRSQDYNTVHKDIYGTFDIYGRVGKMVNIWIPVCGVNENSALPIVMGSHLIPENKILRSKAGSFMNEQEYSVVNILEWGGLGDLESPIIQQDEFLIFSSHLIHGLAHNGNEKETRISFEFRLFGAE